MELEESIPDMTSQVKGLSAQAEDLKKRTIEIKGLIDWARDAAPDPDSLRRTVEGLSKVLQSLEDDPRGKLLKALERMEGLEAALPRSYPLDTAELRVRAGSTSTSVLVHASCVTGATSQVLQVTKTGYSGEGGPVEYHWNLASLPDGWVKLDVLVESQPQGLVLKREIWSGDQKCIFNETLRQPAGGPGSNMAGYAGSDNIRFTNILWVWSDGREKQFALVR